MSETTSEQLDRGEHKALTERDRARKAQVLLEDPLLVAAFEDIHDELLKAFAASGPDDGPRRNDIWRTTKLLDKLKAHLGEHLRTGTLAEATLADIEEKRKRMGMFKRLRSVA